MKFDLIVFINLAAIASIGSPSPATVQRTIIGLVNDWKGKCLPLNNVEVVNTLKSIRACSVPEAKNITYVSDALPYLCLLPLNAIIDSCKTKVDILEKIRYNETHGMRSICDFQFTSSHNNIGNDSDLNEASAYLRSRTKCDTVCNIDSESAEECKRIMRFLELAINATRRDPGISQALPRPAKGSSDGNGDKSVDVKISDDQKVEGVPNGALDIEPNKEDKELAPHTEGTPVSSKGSNSKTSAPGEKTADYESKGEKSSGTKVVDSKNSATGFSTDNNNVNNNDSKNDKNSNRNSAQLIPNSNNKNSNSFNGAQLTDGLLKDESNIKESKLKESLDFSSPDKAHILATSEPLPKGDYEPDIHISHDTKKDDLDEPPINDDNNDRVPEKAELDYNKDEFDQSHKEEIMAEKSFNQKELDNTKNFFQAEDSHFSAYFLMTLSIIIIGYVIYHNKNKIVAYALEGRRSRNGRRRATSAAYRKLDCNLEEAIASNPSHASVTNVVY